MSSKTHILYIIKEYNVLVLKNSGIKRQVEEDFKCKKYITALIGTTAISALATTQAHAATTHTVKVENQFGQFLINTVFQLLN